MESTDPDYWHDFVLNGKPLPASLDPLPELEQLAREYFVPSSELPLTEAPNTKALPILRLLYVSPFITPFRRIMEEVLALVVKLVPSVQECGYRCPPGKYGDHELHGGMQVLDHTWNLTAVFMGGSKPYSTSSPYHAFYNRWRKGMLREGQMELIKALLRSLKDELTTLAMNEPNLTELEKDFNDAILVATQALTRFFASPRFRSERLELLLLHHLRQEDVNMDVARGVYAETWEKSSVYTPGRNSQLFGKNVFGHKASGSLTGENVSPMGLTP
ncbi:hypothetical protein BJ508DRAFT_349947 [Ascobolus immersus RN42]|uniref:Uncharacterized protein n=1 Tax=Ascobolus immersus RN42 TaxID=1160509 RepID=A0A3N4I1H5_ASCIM|nr:hypothetical protein BJ508DRAFT_349947 [Ascobolus immersus RN42]